MPDQPIVRPGGPEHRALPGQTGELPAPLLQGPGPAVGAGEQIVDLPAIGRIQGLVDQLMIAAAVHHRASVDRRIERPLRVLRKEAMTSSATRSQVCRRA